MSEVLLVTTAMMLIGAALMAVFMPAHPPTTASPREVDARVPATVAS